MIGQPPPNYFSNSVLPVLSSIHGTVLLFSFKIKNKIKMVRAWYMDDSDADQRLEHHKEPPEFVTLSELFDVSGTEYFKVDHENYDKDETLLKLKKERGYTYEDQIICSEKCLSNYEEKLKNFFTEHLHTDEEIRLILDGSGYFDVRDKNDKWIRIEVTPGDLLIIPSGIYHRFTLDVKNYIKAKRYFVGEPVWLPYNRPADEMECRKTYLEKIQRGFTVEVK
ncbi:1,2-dihydroxy-3-keto-5-methylthiopentene dioxygenase isoform X1 [Cephus cinctus]|uniref:Acireductone dioxygenase n=1 Tax=Cephus cinctus TaxID=211228 RepID=A0AAJ7CFU7_CEPCN|nr:1,2-dihydroxy-3-keto-5-methylthiopentene dioxygenase isoform X1 [Cephus cinctus]